MDATVFSAINGAHAPWLDVVMLGLSGLGYYGTLLVLSGVLMTVAPRLRAAAFRFLLAVAISQWLASGVIKPLVDRPRPYMDDVVAARTAQASPPRGPSFPSGHATSAFAAAFALPRLAPGAAPLWWVLATAVAYSRVYLGVHYPSDILAGALLGTFCAALVVGGGHRSTWRWSPSLETTGSQLVP